MAAEQNGSEDVTGLLTSLFPKSPAKEEAQEAQANGEETASGPVALVPTTVTVTESPRRDTETELQVPSNASPVPAEELPHVRLVTDKKSWGGRIGEASTAVAAAASRQILCLSCVVPCAAPRGSRKTAPSGVVVATH